MSRLIYKILHPNEWLEAKDTNMYDGSADDRRGGFIHFSTRKQLEGTLKKHFADKINLKLLAFQAESFAPDQLRWETSRGGAFFPHLYGSLDIGTAQQSWDLLRPASGIFDLAFIDANSRKEVTDD